MATYGQFPVVEIPFDQDGTIADLDGIDGTHAQADLEALIPQLDDLIVISHGWNNDASEARALYTELLGNVDAQWETHAHLDPAGKAKTGVLAVFWPSKKFDEDALVAPGQQAPQGGALASIDDAPAGPPPVDYDAKLRAQLDNLRAENARMTAAEHAALDTATAQLDHLEDDDGAKDTFVKALAVLIPDHPEERDPGMDVGTQQIDHPQVNGADVLRQIDAQATASAGAATQAGTGGIEDIGDDSTAPADITGTTLAFDPIGGIKRAALLLLNLTTYYTMKERGGTVGREGVAPLVAAALKAKPTLRVHLVGHSFGGRLVTSLANALDAAAPVASMTLLQAAYSHYGLAPAPTADEENRPEGAFRSVVVDKKVRGGIQISHSNHDWAVGIAYPIASFVRRQVAASIDVPSTANSLWGGMGANGAQQTAEAYDDTMLDAGIAYAALPDGKTIRNLTGNAYISEHGDIRGPQCAWALLQLFVKARGS